MSTLDLGPVAPHRCPDAVYYPGKGWKAPLCVVCDAAWTAQQAPVQAAALAAQGAMFTVLAPTRTTPAPVPDPVPYATLDLFALED